MTRKPMQILWKNICRVLTRLHSRGVITAGYVEKPSADLVVRLLEIATADQEQIHRLREYQPLRGVSDRWLYGERENPLLPPGHRSAVFALQSGSVKKYKGPLALHFFYLNVGTLGHPWPVRVEIPQWVAEDNKKLDLLHCCPDRAVQHDGQQALSLSPAPRPRDRRGQTRGERPGRAIAGNGTPPGPMRRSVNGPIRIRRKALPGRSKSKR